MPAKTILLDFDGVFNQYEGYKGPYDFPDPKPGIADFLAELKERGFTIIIFTARSDKELSRVQSWLEKHELDEYISSVTNKKRPASMYVDDSAITFRGDYKSTLAQIDEFKPYWKSSALLRHLAGMIKK